MVEVKNTDLNIGDIVDCTVEQIMPYGAFVRIIKTGRKGMIHISELSYNFVKDINEFLHVQDNIQAKIIRIDEKGRIDLSIKQTSEPPQTQARPQRANNNREGSREFTHHAANQSQNNNNHGQRMNFRPPQAGNIREAVIEPVISVNNSSSNSAPEELDSFEKKMASFLKTSEAKITDLNSRNSSRSGRSRRSNNNRQDKRDY